MYSTAATVPNAFIYINSLSQLVEAPLVVRKMDWIEAFWPKIARYIHINISLLHFQFTM